MLKRYPIQVAVSSYPDGDVLLVLANDNTLWSYEPTSAQWQIFPDLPQPELPTSPTE